MTVDQLIKKLEDMKSSNFIKGDEQLYIGDKQQTTDYFVRNADGKLTLKEEWY
jgi:hypothetical protein